MEIKKEDIEVGYWTEQIAIAEVGQEGYFDYNGVRIFWRKWGTNPSDWDIIDIKQVEEMTVNQINIVEQKLKDFGFLNNEKLNESIQKIKTNIINNNTFEQTNIANINSINKIKNINNLIQKIPTITPIPFKFQKTKIVDSSFNKQYKQLTKQANINNIQQNLTNDNWFLRFNINIFKKWMKPFKITTRKPKSVNNNNIKFFKKYLKRGKI